MRSFSSMPVARTAAFWISAAVINVLGIMLMFGHAYPGVDLSETIYHVKELAVGRVPYRDIFSHHFLGYLAPFYLIERVVAITPPVQWFLCVVFNFTSAVLNFFVVRTLTCSPRAAHTAALATVTIGWYWNWGGAAFNNQSYFLPIVSLLLLLTAKAVVDGTRSSLYGAGLCFGWLLVNDQRLSFLGLLPLTAIAVQRSLQRPAILARTAAAAALIPALGLAYLAWHGALPHFFEQAIVYPLNGRNAGFGGRTAESIVRLCSWGVRSEFPATLLAVIGLSLLSRYEKRGRVRVLCWAALAASALYAAAAGRDYPNYLLIFAPITIVLLSLPVSYLQQRRPRMLGWYLAAVALLALQVAAAPALYYARTGRWTYPADERVIHEAAGLIRTLTSPQDDVLLIGYAPAMYLLSQRFSGFRDVALLSVTGNDFFSSDSPHGIIPHMADEFAKYLDRTPPAAIVYYQPTGQACSPGECENLAVDSSKTWPMLNMDFRMASSLRPVKDLIERSYQQVATIAYPRDRAEIYLYRGRAS